MILQCPVYVSQHFFLQLAIFEKISKRKSAIQPVRCFFPSITSSPQLTFYHLGYRQVMGLYEDVRKAKGEAFDLRAFMDGMMEMGPVPVKHYRRRMVPE